MKTMLYLILLVMVLASSTARADETGTKGGGSIGLKFVSTAREIHDWLNTNRETVEDWFSVDEFKQVIDALAANGLNHINLTEKPQALDGSFKACINDSHGSRDPKDFTLLIVQPEWTPIKDIRTRWHIVAHEIIQLVGKMHGRMKDDADGAVSSELVDLVFSGKERYRQTMPENNPYDEAFISIRCNDSASANEVFVFNA